MGLTERFGGAAPEIIGAGLLGESPGNGRPADEHFHLVAQAGQFDEVDGLLHRGHGGGEQG
jgi:hypothetical protein